MASSAIYNLDYLKSKGFFKTYGELEIDGKRILWDKDNYLTYVEVENLSELEKIHNKLKKYVKLEYFYYYYKNKNKVKVFKRGCSVAFTYSDSIRRNDVRNSKRDKLNQFSPENMDILFDTKDVMDKFYNELCQLRLELANSIKKPIKDKDKLLVVQHFIDRLVFFYFLCQLGIVKVKYRINGQVYEITMNKETTKSFFEFLIKNLKDFELQKLLNTIFFDGLGNESKVNDCGYVDVHVKVGEWEFNILVPYLNGGLFRDKEILTENNTKIRESEIEFSGVIKLIEMLNQYNWIIGDCSDDDGDSINNLTPEILGHVYEKFVVGLENIGEDIKLDELEFSKIEYEKKSIGAYYTPEEITSYISVNTIIPYLFDKLGVKEYNEILNPKVAFDEFVEHASKDELKKALEILNEIKVLDPACGSGHFLVSAGNLLFDLKESLCNKLIEKFGFEKKLDEYAEVKKIIVDNLYGVDISETAVEIAKLRLWLWLVSQLKNSENIEPLPNLEYNIKCGNSLIGWVDEKLQPTLKYAYTDKIEGIFKDLIAFCNDDKEREMLIKARDLLKSVKGNILDNYVEAFHLIYEIYKTSHGHKAAQLKEILEDVREVIYDCVNPAFLNYINSKLKKNKISEKEFLSLRPFHWRVDFGWIIKEGGFDIVIGNPPYINIYNIPKLDKKIYSNVYNFAYKKYDIYILFIERGLNLLNSQGYISYIIPDKWTAEDYGYKLREYILMTRNLKEIVDLRNVEVFYGVGVRNLIFVLCKSKIFDSILIKNERFNIKNMLQYEIIKQHPKYHIRLDITKIDIDIIKYLLSNSIPLRHVCYVNWGCRPSPSKKYVFNSYEQCLKTTKNKNLCKRLIKGRNVKRYYYNWDGLWLAYLPTMYNPMFPELFENDRIVIKDIGTNPLSVTYICGSLKFYSEHTTINVLKYEVIPKNKIKTENRKLFQEISLKYILTNIISKLNNYFLNKYLSDGLHVLPENTRNLRLKLINDTKPYETIVNYLLFLNAKEDWREKYKENINFFDKEIADSLIYELYFKEKFHEDGLYPEPKEYLLEAVSKHLKPINYDRWAELYWKKQLENNLTKEEEQELKQLEEENLKIIHEVYEKIKKDDIINKLIEKIKSHEWVRIIESS
ncbi:Eco57I restriction-modification methylase domain-containing protein (plasmid) [Methanocaldococcus indicus]